ncbi:putative esterase [Macrophomina phaseolina]|uniref:S-formylglutathione hydrolase n=1 Tax=Macrophomina phaseolina TaxID=35725 RepID=A0ABQ8GJA1_9PEZI|nr:putative esterase [Macrophomina phaseolina]
MAFTVHETIRCFGGNLLKLSHESSSTSCRMSLNLYLPPQAIRKDGKKVPVLMYLSGLTCTADNCSEKGFFQHRASQRGIAMLYPDTSGLGIAGEDDAIDLGTGASYYVDATREPWSAGYKMYTYLTEELPEKLFGFFDELDGSRVSVTGLCVGGHGALTLFLKNPGKYQSCSAFAPVANPINCPWGKKAFTAYFGEKDVEKWKENDATELVKKWKGPLDLLIDIVSTIAMTGTNLALAKVQQGTADHFADEGQLLVDNFMEAAQKAGVAKGIRLRRQPGYNHSYYFMSTFADEHVDYAADALLGLSSTPSDGGAV